MIQSAIVLLLICVPAPRPDEAEEIAVKFVVRLGGKVERAGHAVGKPVVAVNLEFTAVTDAQLKELAGLKHLQKLLLCGTRVTDEGLKELAALKELQTLDLASTRVSDAGLPELAALKELRTLNLRDTWGVTNVGVKELAGLKQLQTLHLSFTRVTDAGLAELTELKQLRKLFLHDTKATAAGVADLQSALPHCEIAHNAKETSPVRPGR